MDEKLVIKLARFWYEAGQKDSERGINASPGEGDALTSVIYLMTEDDKEAED
jgi:hypothetical protein